MLQVAKSTKTGERNIPLLSRVRDALLALRDGHKIDAPVFWGTHPTQPLKHAGFLDIVRRAFRNASIEGKRASPHTLRHTFAKNWIAQDGDAPSLQKMLGHSSLEMVQRYVILVTEVLTRKDEKFNPLISVSDQNIPSNDSTITTDDPKIPLRYTVVKGKLFLVDNDDDVE